MKSNSNLNSKANGYGYPLWVALISILTVSVLVIIIFITVNVRELEIKEIEEAEAASNKIFAALTVSTLESVISEDVAGLETIFEQLFLQVKEIQSIIVKNEEGINLIYKERNPQVLSKHLKTFLKTIAFEGEIFGEISIVWDVGGKILTIKKNAFQNWVATCLPLLILTFIFGISLHFLLLKPMAKIRDRILAINNGNLTPVKTFIGSREIQLLQLTVNNLCHSLKTEHQQREELLVAKQRADQELFRRKQTEIERENLQAELHQAQKLEAIGMLAGRVAHDLNNVLSGIVSYPDLLSKQLPTNSPHLKTVNAIKNSGEKAAAIVQDLLTLARGGITNTEIINVNDVITQYLKSPEYDKLMSFHSNIRIMTNLEEQLFNINGSVIHISKTIMNLISNAVEAMPQGGDIEISTENRYIDQPIQGYDQVQEGDYITLTIADTGVGIPPEDKGKIFEPFFTKKQMGRSGTGLGMAVVWGAVKDHNGYIDIHTSEGEGTTFILYLPITRQVLAQKTEQIAVAAYMGNGESILVVDDVELQRIIATDILSELGYKVIAVSSGEDAIDYVKDNVVDIVLLDMIMDPGIDGIETFRRMKEINPSLKAILASGYSETERIKEIKRLGINQNIKKPYSLEKIGLAVRDELTKQLRG